MPLTNAEIQRRFRERRKQELKGAPDLSASVDGTRFPAFLKERDGNIRLFENLDFVGVEIDGDLAEEDHPLSRAAEWPDNGVELNSLNRAAVMVDAFIDAAKELSSLINQYKVGEIDRRLQTARGADKLKLEQLRKRLDRRTSHFFPVITVKGE